MAGSRDDFLKRLQATFAVEAAEHCRVLATELLRLENAPEEQRPAAIDNMFRAAHSLKGAARAVDSTAVAQICQQLESLFASWQRRGAALSAPTFDALHRAVALLRRALNETPDPAELAALVGALARLEVAGAPPSKPPAHDATPAPPSPRLASAAPPAVGQTAVETVRLDLGRVERVLYRAEDLLALKSILEQRLSEAQDLATLAARADAAPALGPKLAELGRALARDRQAADKLIDAVLDDTKTLLLLPFATEREFFATLVRNLARDQGKEIEFVFRGGEVEVDKRILEQMRAPLVHVLRNAIDHGMERPDARIRHRKPARGTITVAALPKEDQKIEILVQDDGAGIDVAGVKNAAVRRGLLAAGEAASLSPDAVVSLIFRPEVTTSPIVTEVSGRGVGLAILQETVERLGGQLAVQTARGTGTSFRMTLPVAQATFRGVVVSVSDQLFIVPAGRVERVHRIARAEIKTVENRPTVNVAGRATAFVWLADVLGLPAAPRRGASAPLVEFVVMGSGDRVIAFGVDAVLREEEVLVKPLRKPLCRVRNIAGATVLGSGQVVPILNVADLMKSAVGAAVGRRTPVAVEVAAPAERRSILVAEDSITSRMLLKNILESAGYTVKTAVDGLDALTQLRSEPFDLLISDVEMPRMNGFGLAAAVRADPRLAEMPVVLVTALATREDRERGVDAGANAYLVKSSFDQSNLLETVARLV